MRDCTELVEALRYCTNEDNVCTQEKNCGYYGKGFFCQDSLMNDAAAAIEELQFELDCVNDSVKTLSLPIDGKWIRVEDDASYHYECSRCGERPLYSRYGDIVLSGVCPMCGAKMMEVQDEA